MVERILGMRDTYFVILAYIVVYLLPLGLRPLGIPDEMRYAEVPREMIANGDWIVPTLNGVFYFEKPILGYWLNAISISLFGHNAFAVRLPSALMVGLTALLIYFMMNKLVGRRAAIIASIVHLSCLEIFFVGTYAVLDSLLAFTLCGVFVFYFLAYNADSTRARFGYLIVTGIFCGLAFLAKGFLAFALPVIVVAGFLLQQRRYVALLLHPWIPLLVAALVVAPWAYAIHQRAPDFWHYFFWIEHIKRFSADNAQHAAPIWTYFVAFPLLAFPWILILPSGIKRLKDYQQNRQLLIYLALWFILPLLFFSIAKGKLLTYLLPIFPAFAMLMAINLSEYSNAGSQVRWRGERIGLMFLLILVVLLIVLQVSDSQRALFASNEQWQFALFVASLVAGSYCLMRSMQCPDSLSRGLWFSATVLPFFLYWATYVGLPREISNRKTPTQFLQLQERKLSPNTLIVSDDSMLHAVAWTYQRDDIYLLNGGELSYGLNYEEQKFRNLENTSLTDFVEQELPKHDIAIFYLSAEKLARIDKLPKNLAIQEYRVGRFHFVHIKQ